MSSPDPEWLGGSHREVPACPPWAGTFPVAETVPSGVLSSIISRGLVAAKDERQRGLSAFLGLYFGESLTGP